MQTIVQKPMPRPIPHCKKIWWDLHGARSASSIATRSSTHNVYFRDCFPLVSRESGSPSLGLTENPLNLTLGPVSGPDPKFVSPSTDPGPNQSKVRCCKSQKYSTCVSHVRVRPMSEKGREGRSKPSGRVGLEQVQDRVRTGKNRAKA